MIPRLYGLPNRVLHPVNTGHEEAGLQMVPGDPVLAQGHAYFHPYVPRNVRPETVVALGLNRPVLVASSARAVSLHFDRAVPDVTPPETYQSQLLDPDSVIPPEDT